MDVHNKDNTIHVFRWRMTKGHSDYFLRSLTGQNNAQIEDRFLMHCRSKIQISVGNCNMWNSLVQYCDISLWKLNKIMILLIICICHVYIKKNMWILWYRENSHWNKYDTIIASSYLMFNLYKMLFFDEVYTFTLIDWLIYLY